MALTFDALWNAHPEIKGDSFPCRRKDGSKAFEDQCAIRLGTALARCGCNVSQLKAQFCWHHPKKEGHILRAEEMANALHSAPFKGMYPRVKVTAENFEKTLRGERGIIFFKDYWQRSNESFNNRSGDHIDLWNGERITALSSYWRIQWGIHWNGIYSDFFDSKEVWFWKIP